jgi:hypothetical protein
MKDGDNGILLGLTLTSGNATDSGCSFQCWMAWPETCLGLRAEDKSQEKRLGMTQLRLMRLRMESNTKY